MAIDQPQAENTTSDNSDRRRESRVPIAISCAFTVLNPPWAITTAPLRGMTENINLNGLRIALECRDRQQLSGWAEAIKEGTTVKVEVRLLNEPDAQPIRGQLAWVFQDPLQPSDCSIGVMFALLRDREVRLLKDLIAKVNEGS